MANIFGQQHIAGIIYIFQELGHTAQGFINSIDYATGVMVIGGHPNVPDSGERVVINDPGQHLISTVMFMYLTLHISWSFRSYSSQLASLDRRHRYAGTILFWCSALTNCQRIPASMRPLDSPCVFPESILPLRTTLSALAATDHRMAMVTLVLHCRSPLGGAASVCLTIILTAPSRPRQSQPLSLTQMLWLPSASVGCYFRNL